MNFAGQVPEWSVSEAPAMEVTGGLPGVRLEAGSSENGGCIFQQGELCG